MKGALGIVNFGVQVEKLNADKPQHIREMLGKVIGRRFPLLFALADRLSARGGLRIVFPHLGLELARNHHHLPFGVLHPRLSGGRGRTRFNTLRRRNVLHFRRSFVVNIVIQHDREVIGIRGFPLLLAFGRAGWR